MGTAQSLRDGGAGGRRSSCPGQVVPGHLLPAAHLLWATLLLPHFELSLLENLCFRVDRSGGRDGARRQNSSQHSADLSGWPRGVRTQCPGS